MTDDPLPTHDSESTDAVELRILLLPAFAAEDFDIDDDLPNEFQLWRDAYDFSNATSVPGANMPARRRSK